MNRDGSPEEKLLSIIRKKDKPVSSKNPEVEDVREKAVSSGFDRVFRILNQLMILIILVLAGYLLYTFVSSQNKADDFVISEDPTEINEVIDLKEKKSKPYEYYAKQIEARDVFSRPEPEEEVENKVIENIDLSKSLRLVGIVLGDIPEVIIEDIKSNQIFFLHQGDEILEGRVESIKEGKVILNYKGSQTELFQ
ncbi:MAG: hypothetical protein PHY73_01880 [Candidatus Omnitrophica bacterium]|nr:hypothetical protein [Candidatus Omnitrophota bacterium]